MCIQQHLLWTHRSRKQKVHVTVPVHQSFSSGIGNQIRRNCPECKYSQHRHQSPGRIRPQRVHCHSQRHGNCRHVKQYQHKIKIRNRPAQRRLYTVAQYPPIEIPYCPHSFTSHPFRFLPASAHPCHLPLSVYARNPRHAPSPQSTALPGPHLPRLPSDKSL